LSEERRATKRDARPGRRELGRAAGQTTAATHGVFE
jgi:hypothetical protein